MKRRRITNVDSDEPTDRWLVSYADFITLLFAFFVVMYSISNVNLGKYRVLSDSVSSAFSAQRNSPYGVGAELGISAQRAPIALGLLGQTGLVSMRETAAELDARLQRWVKKGMIAVKGNEKWLEIEIKSNLLFNSGDALLSGAAAEVLSELTSVIKAIDRPLYVSGYTDNVPISSSRYPTNWELSTARAASVVRLFAQSGINPARMGAIGYGEYRPVVANDTPGNRQRNRRVVIRVMTGEDVFAQTGPFGDTRVDPGIPLSQVPAEPVNVLQPGEPVRSIFETR
ncbi:Flagellar motor rotation protein MotB [hydrothermal vent metagenome]|uniref:Flagellar motor rotation protein MotB n=1 Tax=hydrothermal vent metagenome TaxID=652676 RepID=A0A3B0Y6J5_9ZZZZ